MVNLRSQHVSLGREGHRPQRDLQRGRLSLCTDLVGCLKSRCSSSASSRGTACPGRRTDPLEWEQRPCAASLKTWRKLVHHPLHHLCALRKRSHAEPLPRFLQKYRWPLTGALLGALVFVALYGVRVLNPASVDWILNNASPDPSQHYLGWEFFRRQCGAPALPRGQLQRHLSRTAPASCLPTPSRCWRCSGKLVSPLLPATVPVFRALGPALCYALQGGLAQAILARLGGVRPWADGPPAGPRVAWGRSAGVSSRR